MEESRARFLVASLLGMAIFRQIRLEANLLERWWQVRHKGQNSDRLCGGWRFVRPRRYYSSIGCPRGFNVDALDRGPGKASRSIIPESAPKAFRRSTYCLTAWECATWVACCRGASSVSAPAHISPIFLGATTRFLEAGAGIYVRQASMTKCGRTAPGFVGREWGSCSRRGAGVPVCRQGRPEISPDA
jgi:hypothetical protein